MGCPVARLAQTWPQTFAINENGVILAFWLCAVREKTHKKASFFCDSARSPHRTTKPSRGAASCGWSEDTATRRLLHVNGAERKLLPENHPHSQEYLNHVTFAPPRGSRPDGVGWLLARRVQTGRRVKLSRPMVRGWYEPCTFEQWVLFEEHSHHTFRRWRRPVCDGRSGLSSTTLDHVSYVSATER